MEPISTTDLDGVTGGHHVFVAARGYAAWWGNVATTLAKMAVEPNHFGRHAVEGVGRGFSITGKTLHRLATEHHPSFRQFVHSSKFEAKKLLDGKPF